MVGLTWKEAGKIGIIGPLATIFIFLLVEVIGGQIFHDLIIGNLDNSMILLLLTLSFFGFAIGSAVIVSIALAQDTKAKSIRRAALYSFIASLGILIVLSYFLLFLLYPAVFSDLKVWYEYFFVVPGVIMYFGVFVLNSVIVMFVFIIILYYILFLYFLDRYYEYKEIDVSDLNIDNTKTW